MIALEDETFLNTYSHYTNAQRLGGNLVKSIVEKLKISNINETRSFEMEQAFNFIKAHTSLTIEKNGGCIAIMPMRCALNKKGAGVELKKKILKEHTLEAVLSMPEDLFYPVGIVTCVMVIKAHIPLEEGYKTYFGFWKDDGFEKRKHQGRIETARWLAIKNKWLNSIKNREVEAGFCITKEITAEYEWCAEAYLETDYSRLTVNYLKQVIRDVVAFKITSNLNVGGIIGDCLIHNKNPKVNLDFDKYRTFALDEIFTNIEDTNR